jgi:cell division protein FtsB
MLEAQKLREAQKLISTNNVEKATPLLWQLYSSNNANIKLNAILSLLAVLDYVTETEKILGIIDEGIKIAASMGKNDVYAFLLGRKSFFLESVLGFLIYRQKNLVLSANVFKWINFATEKEKKEFEAIANKRQQIEKDIREIEDTILRMAEANSDHYFRGHVFMAVGEIYGSRYLNDKLDLMIGGKLRSKIGNIYWIRRWNLDNILLYRSGDRKKILGHKKDCVRFFRRSISELETGRNESDMAHACYNLAVKLNMMFHFRDAKRYLDQAEQLARKTNEGRLLTQVLSFRNDLKNRNKNVRNYVEEFGLDLP